MAAEYKTVDKFDAVIGSLSGRGDVTTVQPSTKQVLTPVIGGSQQFTVQTFRVADEGDWVLVQYLDGDGSLRLAIPPAVADTIARQRDALSAKNRKRAAKHEAARRKAAGIQPGFMKGRKAKKAVS